MQKTKFIFPAMPLLFWYGIFTVLPIFVIFFFSIYNNSDNGFLGSEFTLKNYSSVFSSAIFPAFRRSFINSFSVSILLVILTLPVTAQLAQFGKNRKWMLLLLAIPFISSTLLRIYAVVFLFRDNGLVNHLFKSSDISFLYNGTATFWGYIYFYFPFMCFPLYDGFENIDPSLKQVGTDLGLNRWQIFCRITLPVVRPAVYNGFTLVFLLSIGDFLIPQLLGGDKQLFISSVIYREFALTRNWTQSSALALEVMLFAVAFVFSIQAAVESVVFKRIFKNERIA